MADDAQPAPKHDDTEMKPKQQRRAYLKDPNIKKAIESEHLTGVRYCSKCDKFLSLDQFKPPAGKNKRQFMCISHLREKARIEAMGTKPKRAYNILRSMARPDMIEFGHLKMNIGRPAVLHMLSEEHIANPGEYCLMPKRPDRPLSVPNSIILTRPQRLYLINRWRKTKDAQQYMRDLWHLLESPPSSSSLFPADGPAHSSASSSETWARLFDFE
jgi:hypothetical protein